MTDRTLGRRGWRGHGAREFLLLIPVAGLSTACRALYDHAVPAALRCFADCKHVSCAARIIGQTRSTAFIPFNVLSFFDLDELAVGYLPKADWAIKNKRLLNYGPFDYDVAIARKYWPVDTADEQSQPHTAMKRSYEFH